MIPSKDQLSRSVRDSGKTPRLGSAASHGVSGGNCGRQIIAAMGIPIIPRTYLKRDIEKEKSGIYTMDDIMHELEQ